MPANLNGKWSIAKHDSFDALMDLLQVDSDKRPPSPITQLTVVITQEGDKFTFNTTTAKGSNEYSFDVGATFETQLVGWMPAMKVSTAWEGDSLVFTNEQGFKLVRKIDGEQMVTTIGKDATQVKVYFNKA